MLFYHNLAFLFLFYLEFSSSFLFLSHTDSLMLKCVCLFELFTFLCNHTFTAAVDDDDGGGGGGFTTRKINGINSVITLFETLVCSSSFCHQFLSLSEMLLL